MASTENRAPRAPTALDAGGRALWRGVVKDHPDLDALQLVQLAEACRAKDRLDRLDKLLTGDADTWATLVHRADTEDYELRIDSALAQANATATVLKQLLAALRLPDPQTGTKPQHRGAPRGAYKPGGAAPTPTKLGSLERARAAKQQSS